MKYIIIATNPAYDLDMIIKELETDFEGDDLLDYLSEQCDELEQSFYKTVVLTEKQLLKIKKL